MSFPETFLRNRQLRRAQRRGAQWLDRHAPGWWNGPAALRLAGTESRRLHHIDLDLLDLSSGAECVLGQLWGGPEGGQSGYGAMRSRILRDDRTFDTVELGFCADDGYDKLTEYWRDDIRRRRRKRPERGASKQQGASSAG